MFIDFLSRRIRFKSIIWAKRHHAFLLRWVFRGLSLVLLPNHFPGLSEITTAIRSFSKLQICVIILHSKDPFRMLSLLFILFFPPTAPRLFCDSSCDLTVLVLPPGAIQSSALHRDCGLHSGHGLHGRNRCACWKTARSRYIFVDWKEMWSLLLLLSSLIMSACGNTAAWENNGFPNDVRSGPQDLAKLFLPASLTIVHAGWDQCGNPVIPGVPKQPVEGHRSFAPFLGGGEPQLTL